MKQTWKLVGVFLIVGSVFSGCGDSSSGNSAVGTTTVGGGTTPDKTLETPPPVPPKP